MMMMMSPFYDKSADINPLVLSLLLLFLLVHPATQENQTLGFEFNNNHNTTSNSIVTTSVPTITTTPVNQLIFDCLPTCECNYNKSNQRLEVNCGKNPESIPINITNEGGQSQRIIQLNIVTEQVRTLVLRHLELENKSSYKAIPLFLPNNTLIQLELHHVNLDPMEFFNSGLFKSCKTSLRRLHISQSSARTTEIFLMDTKETLNAFSTLESLDSLTICDSNPSLAHVILHALPNRLNHLQVFNSSTSSIYYSSFSHLESLQSLNLSYNQITTLPNGLFDNLGSLKSLDLSHNHLTHLQEGIFLGLKSTRKLDLSHNSIQYVDAEVFTQLEDLQTIDLSQNEVIQFFEPYFKHNNNLRVINMSNAWVSHTFINENAVRSYREMDGLISTLRLVQVLDLSDNEMTIIPETLSHVQRLTNVYLNGNPWICTCDDRWFSEWIANSNVSIDGKMNRKEDDDDDTTPTKDSYCFPPPTAENNESTPYPLIPYISNLWKTCNNTEITARYTFKYYAVMGKDKVLSCHTRTTALPTITWVTPSKNRITLTANYTSVHQQQEHQEEDGGSGSGEEEGSEEDHDEMEPTIYPDGALLLHKVNGSDYGLYLCIASYDGLNITHYVHVGMDVANFEDVKLFSLLVGLISSFGFLFLVLLAQLIRCLLLRSGLKCIAVRTANQARRVRAFFDSMEQNKNSQLDWLRQNYNDQAKKIQDNCICQLERIRESYTSQTKNLSEFREYSAQQLTTMRDQYQDQIRKVASYSAHRLGKVRENYVFNRNRVGKFSSHQLIRLREAYKWQAQTLNKILENLPQGLNLDACRGVGVCGRTESVGYLDEDSEDFIGHSSTSNTSSQGLKQLRPEDLLSEDKNEHISLLIPPEFLASYLLPPIPNLKLQETLMADISSRADRGEILYLKGSALDRELNGHCSKSCGEENLSNLPFADEDV